MSKRRRSRRSASQRRRRGRDAAVEKVDFAAEYAYVAADLKRLAVVAAAMFALLIGLALVLA